MKLALVGLFFFGIGLLIASLYHCFVEEDGYTGPDWVAILALVAIVSAGLLSLFS